MSHQDWKPTVFEKKTKPVKLPPLSNNTSKSTKIDNETEVFTHNKLDFSFKKALQTARLASKITQKDLATKLNVKPQVINSYESGKVIPDNAFIAKMERILNCKLPRAKKK